MLIISKMERNLDLFNVAVDSIVSLLLHFIIIFFYFS